MTISRVRQPEDARSTEHEVEVSDLHEKKTGMGFSSYTLWGA